MMARVNFELHPMCAVVVPFPDILHLLSNVENSTSPMSVPFLVPLSSLMSASSVSKYSSSLT